MDEKPLKNLKKKIICNIAFTKYEIVKHVTKKILGWKVTKDEEDEKWDVLWTDSAVPPEKLAKMQHYQKINHFPGMYSISRKNYLAMNLTKLKKKFVNDYNFFPKTWIFPCDLSELKLFLQGKKKTVLIVKPEASCQGRGIFLTRKPENIDPAGRYVIQEYLAKPFLIDNLKFDLRIYVLVAGCDPLRIFVHEAGLTRFATEEYSKPSSSNLDDMCMHLTNYAVNKNNPNFIHNEDSSDDESGHKRSLQSTYDYLARNDFDVQKLQQQIDDAIIKTLCSIQPNLAHHYKSCQPEDLSNSMCFEILGFDIILDSKARPFVLEVNHTPSFTTDSPLDRKIKKKVIKDALVLMNISYSDKINFLKQQKMQILKRAVSGKLEKNLKGNREEKIKELQNKRDKWENKHHGGYRKIYPIEGHEEYEKYIKCADEIYQELTGMNISRAKKFVSDRNLKFIQNDSAKKSSQTRTCITNKEEVLKTRCSSIPNLKSPNESERNNASTVFERLYKSTKPKSTRTNPHNVVYTEENKGSFQLMNYPTARPAPVIIDSRTLYTRNTVFRQMAPKLFQFHYSGINYGT